MPGRGMAVPVALKCKFHQKSGEKIIQDFIMRGMAAPIASRSFHLLLPYRTISHLKRLNREPIRLK